jgi:hypothetical protein
MDAIIHKDNRKNFFLLPLNIHLKRRGEIQKKEDKMEKYFNFPRCAGIAQEVRGDEMGKWWKPKVKMKIFHRDRHKRIG